MQKKQNVKSLHKASKKEKTIPIIISSISIVIIVVAVTAIVINVIQMNRNNSLEYSIAPDPETGEPPLFGNDPDKDNSGEAFVEFEKRIIASPDYSVVEKNNARIAIAVHYNAIGMYEDAKEVLQTLEMDVVFGEQLKQYYLTYADANSGLGETEQEAINRSLAEQVEL